MGIMESLKWRSGESFLEFQNRIDDAFKDLTARKSETGKVSVLDSGGEISPAGPAAQREGRAGLTYALQQGQKVPDPGSVQLAEAAERDALRSMIEARYPGKDLVAMAGRAAHLDEKAMMQSIQAKPKKGRPGFRG